MKTKNLPVLCIVLLIAVFAASMITAGTINLSSIDVTVDDVANSVVAAPGEKVTVEVRFVSNQDLEDAKVKAWVSGYKDDVEDSTSRFDVIAGKTYVKRLSLTLPNVNDIDNLDEDLTVRVELSDKNDDVEAPEYTVTIQRDSYTFKLLSVEAPQKASAGEIIAIDVVLKNIGRHDLEDAFVVARIPELGIYKKVYFGDIAPEDNYADDDDEDARERRIYLVIPNDAVSGEYDLEVKASNYDSVSEILKSITIEGVSDESTAVEADDEESNEAFAPNTIVILTVVLVIIFLVLLIVLIVLLTRKPEQKEEDFGETSYY